jgi:hypothetical protein
MLSIVAPRGGEDPGEHVVRAGGVDGLDRGCGHLKPQDRAVLSIYCKTWSTYVAATRL